MAKTCGNPGPIDHGYPSGSKSSYNKDDEVGYICNNGYSSVGTPTTTCNGTHWIGAPKCRLDFIDDGLYSCLITFLFYIYIYIL